MQAECRSEVRQVAQLLQSDMRRFSRCPPQWNGSNSTLTPGAAGNFYRLSDPKPTPEGVHGPAHRFRPPSLHTRIPPKNVYPTLMNLSLTPPSLPPLPIVYWPY